jgi:glycosyltransferase involved in cell wall biosynthesis
LKDLVGVDYMNEIRFSVIVPLYNKANYIKRTLNSILHQTFCDYELIVVDDGSTDGSFEIALKILGSKNNKYRVITQPNAGVSSARNNGVDLSKGEYVCFLDSDDWWEPGFLEEMNRLIDDYPDAGLYGTGFNLVKNGKKRKAPIGVDDDFDRGYIDYCQVYAKNLCMPITSSSVVIPRDVFVLSGKFREGITLGEDFDLWIRIALKYPVVLVNKPLANYFQDVPVRDSATRKLRDPKTHMLWNLDYLEEEETRNTDLKKSMDMLRANGLCRFYLSHQYHKEAMAHLAKIDWNNVSQQSFQFYHSPLFLERFCFKMRTIGAVMKHFFSEMY